MNFRPPSEFLTREAQTSAEIAERLNVEPQTVRAWVRAAIQAGHVVVCERGARKHPWSRGPRPLTFRLPADDVRLDNTEEQHQPAAPESRES
jgi:transposase-like protein